MLAKKSALILITMISLFGFFYPVHSQGFNFGLRPEDQSIGYFQYSLRPGESVVDAVLAVNASDDDLALMVSVVAGHTALTGGVAFPGEADGPAKWIDLPDEGVVNLQAGQVQRLPFTITVPVDAEPGEYVAGFLSTPANPPLQDGVQGGSRTISVNVIPQMGVSIIITVPGPQKCDVQIHSIAEEIDKGRWQLVVTMENLGNIHFKGSGQFTLRPATGGDPLMEKSFKIGYFVAGDTIGYPIYIEGIPPSGDFVAEITLIADDCEFQSVFTQPMAISSGEVQAAQKAARKWTEVRQVNAQEGSPLVSVKEYETYGFLFLFIANLVFAAPIFFVIYKKRRHETKE